MSESTDEQRGNSEPLLVPSGDPGGLDYIAAPLRPLALPLDSLTLDPANARTHDQKNLSAIKGSLSRFGQRLPLVVQKQGMIVRAGNGRVMAARELGWTHMACVVVDESEVEATAFAIADNRSAELATWDDEALASLLDTLPKDVLPDTGFTDAELADLMEKLTPAEPKEGLQLTEQLGVLVECETEAQQREIYEEMEQRGLKCRVLTL